MRRTDKEITDPKLISQIIENAQICRLGLAKDNIPYVLPVSFGFDGTAIASEVEPIRVSDYAFLGVGTAAVLGLRILAR